MPTQRNMSACETILAEPDDVRPQLAAERAHVSQSNVGLAEVCGVARVFRAPRVQDLAVKVKHVLRARPLVKVIDVLRDDSDVVCLFQIDESTVLAYRFISARAARIVFASSGLKASRPSFSESMTAASAFISSTVCRHCFFRLAVHSRVDETHPAVMTAAMVRQHATKRNVFIGGQDGRPVRSLGSTAGRACRRPLPRLRMPH